MIMKSLVKSAAALLLGGVMVAGTANAAEFEMRQASDLDDLLKLVKERALFESAVNKDREREFIQKKAQQQSMLNSAKAERTAQEQRSDRLETQFEENERRLGQLQEQLDTRLGSLRELFGVLQQVAGDTVGVFEGSVVSAQFPGRGEPLQALAAKMGKST
jgi:biopolymer transport protein ExbB